MPSEDEGLSPAPAAAAPVPRVQVVVVTRDGHFLDDTLSSLARQTWPELTVVVSDSGSADVDPGPAARRHGATLVRVEESSGFAEAGRAVASDMGLGAAWRLFCAEGTVLEPEAVELLVHAAEDAGAGVAGPKLVDARDQSVLVEVGLTGDRFGVGFTSVDHGEVDHGQHDGTREVLYVSTRCLLVRDALFERLGGFDLDYRDEGIDLDLCWRARLVDGPVIVVPEARARVGAAPPADDRLASRNRLRTIIKCSSLLRLIALLPQLVVLGLAEAATLGLARRGREARRVFGAWWWNLRHLPSTLQLRWRVQRHRVASDRAVRALQVGGSARIREYLESRLDQAGGPLAESGTGDHLGEELRSAAARPQALFWLLSLGIVLLGVRLILVGPLPEGGQLLVHEPPRGLLGSYVSSWRFDGFGSPGGGLPHHALLTLVKLLGLSSLVTGMRMVLVGGYLGALIGMWRLVSRIEPWPAPGVAVAVYGLSPVLFAATDSADVGAFWMWAFAPFLMARLLDPFDARLAAVPSVFAGALLLALATALFPPAPLVYMASATALLLGTLPGEGRVAALRSWARAAASAAAALLLLVPGSLQILGLIGDGTLRPWYLRWSQLRVSFGAGEAIGLHAGPVGAGLLAAAPALLGLFALACGRGRRLTWAIRLWPVALFGMAAMYLAGQDLIPAAPRLFPGVLAMAAVAVAALSGIGVASARLDLSDRPFGWRQFVAALLSAGLVLSLVPALGRLVRSGQLGLGPDLLRRAAVFLRESDTERALWIGPAGSLPGDSYPLRGQPGAYVVTQGLPDPGDVLLPAPSAGDAELNRALDTIREGTTQRGGRLLAPFGVRWVVVMLTARKARVDGPAPDANLVTALGRQLDLAEKRVDPGLAVYENTSVLRGPLLLERTDLVDLALAATVDASALEASDLAGAPGSLREEGREAFRGRIDAPEGGLLLIQQSFDPAWSGRLGGSPLKQVPAFGWAQGYVVPAGAAGVVVVGIGSLRLLAVLGQVALWVFAMALWRRRTGPAEDV